MRVDVAKEACLFVSSEFIMSVINRMADIRSWEYVSLYRFFFQEYILAATMFHSITFQANLCVLPCP